jgi:hypothetical protein
MADLNILRLLARHNAGLEISKELVIDAIKELHERLLAVESWQESEDDHRANHGQ